MVIFVNDNNKVKSKLQFLKNKIGNSSFVAGRNFDKDGNLALWWSQESIDAFTDRAQCFIDQYDNFHPPEVADESVHVRNVPYSLVATLVPELPLYSPQSLLRDVRNNDIRTPHQRTRWA